MANTFKWNRGDTELWKRDIMALTPAEMVFMTKEQITEYNNRFLT